MQVEDKTPRIKTAIAHVSMNEHGTIEVDGRYALVNKEELNELFLAIESLYVQSNKRLCFDLTKFIGLKLDDVKSSKYQILTKFDKVALITNSYCELLFGELALWAKGITFHSLFFTKRKKADKWIKNINNLKIK